MKILEWTRKITEF